MSKEEIEKAQREAEAHADEDKKKREVVEARNFLENSIYQAEKMPKEYGEKLSDEDKKTIEDAVNEAKSNLESDDREVLEKSAQTLMASIQPIGAKMYESAKADESSSEASAEEGTSDKKDDEAVEGEVVNEKERK